MAEPVGERVTARYARRVDVVVIWIVLGWHVANDLTAVIRFRSVYHPFAAAAAAWLVLAVVGVAGAVRLRRRLDRPLASWLLAAVALAASALGTAAVPANQLLGAANWTWGAGGWFGVLLLLRRPLRELVAVIALNSATTLDELARGGVLQHVTAARFGMVLYATAVLQLAVPLGARALEATVRHTAELAASEAGIRRRQHVADALHASRQARYQLVSRSTKPLVAGLASGQLDPGDRGTQHRCAIEASRLRRLYAETDEAAEPLLHELRACADLADRRGVAVELEVVGHLPALDVPARRALLEEPMRMLATAERAARVTMVGRPDEVAVSVVSEGGTGAAAAWESGAGRGTGRGAGSASGSGAAEPVPGGQGEVTVTVLEEGTRLWVEARWRAG